MKGDGEVITADFDKIPKSLQKLLVAATIHESDINNSNFGMADNAFICIANLDNGKNIACYDLTEDYSTEISLIFAEICKKDGQWRAIAKGDDFAEGVCQYTFQHLWPEVNYELPSMVARYFYAK